MPTAPTMLGDPPAVPSQLEDRVLEAATRGDAPWLTDRLREARAAQIEWREVPVRDRLKVVRRFRHALAAGGESLAAALTLSVPREPALTLAAEIIPLADACRFLERNAERLLRPRAARRSDRPFWLPGVDVIIRREPRGVVLVLGAWNFPLLLPGVQIAQALAAGNAVALKPSPRGAAAADMLRDLWQGAGLPAGLLQILPDPAHVGELAVRLGVDQVVLTGSSATGRRVLSVAAERLTPCTVELSGCDAACVLAGADVDRAARCIAYGLTLNHGATCIAPRRVFVDRRVSAPFTRRLVEALSTSPHLSPPRVVARQARELVDEALRSGGRLVFGELCSESDGRQDQWPLVVADARAEMRLLRTDLFAPVAGLIEFTDMDEVCRACAACPYALGASIFGQPAAAHALAERLDAGCVTINDLIVPTADPRVPFSGRRESGFGVTRGTEGLLELTSVKAIVRRRGGWLPHLSVTDSELLCGVLRAAHGAGWRARVAGGWRVLRAWWRTRRGGAQS